MRGEIVFEHVTFALRHGEPVLRRMSPSAPRRAQTVAIVGQTGSGKSTLTKLVNRIYDVDAGRVLIDGVDVRDWSLDSLRSQISTIEQDILLFSRTIAENIAFGLGQRADARQIERAADDAQAHEFIIELPRRLRDRDRRARRDALGRPAPADRDRARVPDRPAHPDPGRLDQRDRQRHRGRDPAARSGGCSQGRTTLLITHRLSQIRWADTHPGAATRRAGRPGHARGAAGALRRLPPDLRALRRRTATRPRRCEWQRRRASLAGADLNGLHHGWPDAEAYDRNYSDRQLVRADRCDYFRPAVAHDAAGRRADGRARLAGRDGPADR